MYDVILSLIMAYLITKCKPKPNNFHLDPCVSVIKNIWGDPVLKISNTNRNNLLISLSKLFFVDENPEYIHIMKYTYHGELLFDPTSSDSKAISIR